MTNHALHRHVADVTDHVLQTRDRPRATQTRDNARHVTDHTLHRHVTDHVLQTGVRPHSTQTQLTAYTLGLKALTVSYSGVLS